MASQNIPIESPYSREAAIRFWINPDTGKPNFPRCTAENLEQRTVASVELYQAGYYKSLAVSLTVITYRFVPSVNMPMQFYGLRGDQQLPLGSGQDVL